MNECLVVPYDDDGHVRGRYFISSYREAMSYCDRVQAMMFAVKA